MDKELIIEQISQKSFDKQKYVELVNRDDDLRDFIFQLMINDEAIMVYYHSYYIISAASKLDPERYYPFWNDLTLLLDHNNSYHRNFALEIIANLVPVDIENQFSGIKSKYFSLINDEKFMTGHCCLQQLPEIYRCKTDLRVEILDIILHLQQYCDYSQKQIDLMQYDVLLFIESQYDEIDNKDRLHAFILNAENCVSPKTRKKAGSLRKALIILP